jgi:DNA-directed RNA polymerase alpha subunit
MSTFYRVSAEEQRLELAGTTEAPQDTFLEDLRNKMRIQIITLNEESIVFDIKGIDAAIANALRRILLAEVPTMAIETVYIENNTSIIQDEVLSHRLGLIPINANPTLFETYHEEDGPTDLNTIVFNLKATWVEGSADADGTMYVCLIVASMRSVSKYL